MCAERNYINRIYSLYSYFLQSICIVPGYQPQISLTEPDLLSNFTKCHIYGIACAYLMSQSLSRSLGLVAANFKGAGMPLSFDQSSLALALFRSPRTANVVGSSMPAPPATGSGRAPAFPSYFPRLVPVPSIVVGASRACFWSDCSTA